FFFVQAEDGIRDRNVTGVQTCALPISHRDGVANGVLAEVDDDVEPFGGCGDDVVVSAGPREETSVRADLGERMTRRRGRVEPEPAASRVRSVQEAEQIARAVDLECGPWCAADKH